MAGLVFAAIAPHGVALIPELSADAAGALATRTACIELGRRCAAQQPDVIVVATPHGTRVDGAICLAAAAHAFGTLHWQARTIEMHLPLDPTFTDTLHSVARARNIPMARASFGGNRRDQSSIALDWGTMVPLWFLGHGQTTAGHGHMLAEIPATVSGPPIVIAAPSRLLPRATMLEFGTALAEAAAQDGRRIAFVASCDWAHTHSAAGPYGFHPAAAEVDAWVVAALRANAPERLLELSDAQVEAAAIDGLWQTLMLAGAMRHTPLQGEVLSYEAPDYFGMLVAAFEPCA